MKTIHIFLLLLFVSCLPTQQLKNTRLNQSTSNDNPTPLPSPDDLNNQNNYWFSDSTTYDSVLDVGSDFDSIIYLRGENIHEYLDKDNNNSKTYCIVFNYTSTYPKPQLRARAVPISFTNLSSGTRERLFRVDLNQDESNEVSCLGDNIAHEQITAGVDKVNAAFKPSDVCSTCTSSFQSLKDLKIYTTTSNTLSSAVNSVILSNLALKIVPSPNYTPNPGGSCDSISCQAIGFDCCVNGQCVNDGQVKSGVDTTSTEYLQALEDIIQNPENYTNYPDYFYVCLTNPQVTPTPTVTPDAQATANQDLLERIIDKKCLDDYLANNTVQTYCASDHSCLAGSYSITELSGADFSNVDMTGCTLSYNDVKSRVYTMCGCNSSSPSTDCPDYTLESVFNEAGTTILDVRCKSPIIESDPTPIQNLNTNVSGRHTPHRFFKLSDGTSVDDIASLYGTPEATPVSEGTPFSYLDPGSYFAPDNVALNMNAIVGQMSLTLDQALPAKQFTVEYDQTYVISAIGGLYTPCPTCQADPWFAAFRPYVNSQRGVGLQAYGHTTSRDAYSTNISGGNYQETKFGRACWLPPTMLPFSHQANADVQTQRLNRLATQAALWMNGYQRDWWGFNQGALIGSFDGVTWFAIGTGRRVRATSTKLFLAINAPYADLADNSQIAVNIIEDRGTSTAADLDFDPNLSLSDSRQNQAASCQQYHSCKNDSECVSKLGWEYMCSAVNSYRTLWPTFDTAGNENVNAASSKSILGFLQQDTYPSGSLKRCVYRGSGAPCKQDYSNLPNSLKKLFTCAPNFYCERVNESRFNNEIVRTTNDPTNIFYGLGANILGRQQNYVSASTTFATDVISNLQANGVNQDTLFNTDSDTGLCRPAKKLDTNNNDPNPIEQHSERDSNNRTDYISQIAGCDSTASTHLKRVQTCPIFNSDGDYYYPTLTAAISDATIQQEFWMENQCGGKAVLANSSSTPFDEMEYGILTTLNSLLQPGMVKDACLRRAGAVCHTNLDCGPNALHEKYAKFYGVSYFGNTEAEKAYWTESLICSQADDIPFLNSPNFATYDLTKNKCCRATGKDFTMYTEGDPETYDENSALNVSLFSGTDPDADGRYSRYEVVGALQDSLVNSPLTPTPFYGAPKVYRSASGTPSPGDTVTPIRYQWRTITKTGNLNCCGGTFIRKFADGTTNWKNSNRINLNPADWSCLNYPNSIALEKPDLTDQTRYDQDFGSLCWNPEQKGCAQRDLADTAEYEISVPRDFDSTFGGPLVTSSYAEMNTFLNTDDTDNPYYEFLNFFAPFVPQTVTVTVTPGVVPSTKSYFEANSNKLAFKIPSYIATSSYAVGDAWSNIVSYHFTDDEGNLGAALIPVVDHNRNTCLENSVNVNGDFCVNSETHTLYAFKTASANIEGFAIRFHPVNTVNFDYTAGVDSPDTTKQSFDTPGNDLYYLTKLARLELSGIPQMFYEPVFCNSDRSVHVDNLYKTAVAVSGIPAGTSITDRTAVNAHGYDYKTSRSDISELAEIYDFGNTTNDDANPNDLVFLQENLQVDKVFSSYEFKCCKGVGIETTSDGQCCSNFSQIVDGKRICRLPAKTNLNVYFNRFVSSDGADPDPDDDDPDDFEYPGGGFTDDDFIAETGEPKLRIETYTKLVQMGINYCENGTVRTGAAFGSYQGEPNNPGSVPDVSSPTSTLERYGVTDSFNDFDPNIADPNSPRSLSEFNKGFRWNHHVYCAD